tara:strand:- start:2422 stop:2697 length:276 start_codon:yes stop_codon:yes gene_type:complete
VKPSQESDLREVELETDTTDGNRATRFFGSGWKRTSTSKPNLELAPENGRHAESNRNTSVGMRETATGKEEGDLREARIDTTLGTNHFGGR